MNRRCLVPGNGALSHRAPGGQPRAILMPCKCSSVLYRQLIARAGVMVCLRPHCQSLKYSCTTSAAFFEHRTASTTRATSLSPFKSFDASSLSDKCGSNQLCTDCESMPRSQTYDIAWRRSNLHVPLKNAKNLNVMRKETTRCRQVRI